MGREVAPTPGRPPVEQLAYSSPQVRGTAPAYKRSPWYRRAWDGVVDEISYLPATIRAFPGAYWRTARSGQQISSLSGFTDKFTDTVNPFGGGTHYGPLMGQRDAYDTGGRVGTATGHVENVTMAAAGIYGLGRAAPGLVRSAPGALRNAGSSTWNFLRNEGMIVPTADVVGASESAALAGTGIVGETAAGIEETRRIYSARALARAAQEPGPFHNFPQSFDDVIFSQGRQTVKPGYFRQARPGLSDDSIQYTLPGEVNGEAGIYEIFTRPSTSGRNEVIMHRFFRPNRN